MNANDSESCKRSIKSELIKHCSANDQFEGLFNQKFKEVTALPFKNKQLAAVMYVATIVYPNETNKRDEFITAMGAGLMRYYDPKGRKSKDHAKVYKKYPTRKIKNQLNQAFNIMNSKRYVASLMYHHLRLSKLTPKALTRKELIDIAHTFNEFYLDDEALYLDDSSIRQRVWNNSKSVICLTYAYFMAIKKHGEGELFFDCFINADWIYHAVEMAEEELKICLVLELSKPQVSKINFAPENIIRLIYSDNF